MHVKALLSSFHTFQNLSQNSPWLPTYWCSKIAISRVKPESPLLSSHPFCLSVDSSANKASERVLSRFSPFCLFVSLSLYVSVSPCLSLTLPPPTHPLSLALLIVSYLSLYYLSLSSAGGTPSSRFFRSGMLPAPMRGFLAGIASAQLRALSARHPSRPPRRLAARVSRAEAGTRYTDAAIIAVPHGCSGSA